MTTKAKTTTKKIEPKELTRLKNLEYNFKMVKIDETEYGNFTTTELIDVNRFDKEIRKLIKAEGVGLNAVAFIGYTKEINVVEDYINNNVLDTFFARDLNTLKEEWEKRREENIQFFIPIIKRWEAFLEREDIEDKQREKVEADLKEVKGNLDNLRKLVFNEEEEKEFYKGFRTPFYIDLSSDCETYGIKYLLDVAKSKKLKVMFEIEPHNRKTSNEISNRITERIVKTK